jgi:hypothetical protein
MIQKVIRDAIVPSWLGSPPTNYGEAASGSMKAHEWRLLGTCFIPIALVICWGESSVHHDPEERNHLRAVLDHAMHLSQAVFLVMNRVMTAAVADQYREHLREFVKGLRILHPSTSIKPNHHLSFHIYEFLDLFGPLASWWCFPYERLIGRLQKMNTNNIHGKYKLIHP